MVQPDRIVFYDGPCGLCHRFVLFLLRQDRKQRLFFSALQSQEAAKRLGSGAAFSETVLYFRHGKILEKSSAAIWAVADLGGVWSVLVIALVVPRFIRDRVYSFVAKRRFQWFGKDEKCQLLSQADRSRFLDKAF